MANHTMSTSSWKEGKYSNAKPVLETQSLANILLVSKWCPSLTNLRGCSNSATTYSSTYIGLKHTAFKISTS